MGVVESIGSHVSVATSLNVPQKQGRIWIQCMNPGPQPLTLHPGETVGRYSAAEGVQVLNSEEDNPAQVKALIDPQRGEGISSDSETIPKHLLPLYPQGKNSSKILLNCNSSPHYTPGIAMCSAQERRMLAIPSSLSIVYPP